MATSPHAKFPPLNERPVKDTVCLFDVDGTLTLARLAVGPDMLDILQRLRNKVAIGFVGGSDLAKQQEQLGVNGANVIDMFDFCFAENGLTAYRQGVPLDSNSFIKWLGEERYKPLANFILHYLADLDLPVKRGTFIEFRNGMINVSPIGRNASVRERNDFEAYDKVHKVRATMVQALRSKFPDYGLKYSIGGQISFDVFPEGWDKTYCLQYVTKEFSTVHFFGDKTYEGGNDYEIYEDNRTIGHSVTNPQDTINELKKLFDL